MAKDVSLDDKYDALSGRVLMTGTQALVRLPMTQMRRDKAAGLKTAAFISGYRGSPLGAYDQQLVKAKKRLEALEITFQPGVNEDLAATAVWGSQQTALSKGSTHDGVVGIWYGKAPGVDRSGDAFKHANTAGTSRHGGVLAIAGDDHTCKSSSLPNQSDHAFIAAMMPTLYPSSIHEFLEYGLFGVAMSRWSGCWVGFKVIADTVETTAVVDLAQESREFVLPDDFDMPPGGLNLRWPDSPLAQDERMQEYKVYAARAFARANRVDEVMLTAPHARFGLVASGKAYEDAREALRELGIGEAEARAIGLRIYKSRMPWPLEPEGVRGFSEGLEEVLILEERREMIENQIKQQLFNWRADVRPRIVGKVDERDRAFLPLSAGLTVSVAARAIAERLLRMPLPEDLRGRIAERLTRLEALKTQSESRNPPTLRKPHFCAGCPHNTSTRVIEGSKAMAGVGCHYMATWMDRETEVLTQMGAEGVTWTAAARYTTEKHRFVNIGDGTWFHSGILAVRQAVSANVNITYKLLYNDAVAMTGGQPIDGTLTPQQAVHQIYNEGVRVIRFLTEKPELYQRSDFPPGVIIRHRDAIDSTMKELRDTPGVTAIVFEQTCAAEKRRRRKAGLMEDPDLRVFINTDVCEGCGDCSKQSNCVAVEPIETPFGRKRVINQSACNKDLSCVRGFCPSFVTLEGVKPARRAAERPDGSGLPEPVLPGLARPWSIAVAGVGGTGVMTIGAVLAMAAHLEGKNPLVMDMAGLAQKGGAAFSHIRIGAPGEVPTSPRIANGGADLLLAADLVVAASKDGLSGCDAGRTAAVVNTRMTPTSDFMRIPDFDFKIQALKDMIRAAARPGAKDHEYDFSALAVALTGDEIGANFMMTGYACQKGLIPLAPASIEGAIRMNGVSVQNNLDALTWGRLLAHDPAIVLAKAAPARPPAPDQNDMSLEEIVSHRKAHLTDYQDEALAARYEALVRRAEQAAARLSDPAMAERLARAVALNYAKLLAYKDEYEVARLYSSPAFTERLREAFAGDAKISFHLAPPILPGMGADGRPKKRRFSASLAMPMFRRLAKMKHLRGGPMDVFGRSAERKAERALIAQYETDAEALLSKLDAASAARILEILSLPDGIRGFGPVKEEAMRKAAARREALLQGRA